MRRKLPQIWSNVGAYQMIGKVLICNVRTILCVCLIASTGCSSQPRIGLISRGETVSIKPPSTELTSTANNISNDSIANDAKTGAGAGALTGAAWGLSCGFFAIICSPIGALAGAITGGSTGAIVGSTKGLTDEQAQQLTSNIHVYLQANVPAEDIHDALLKRASNEWTVVEVPVDGKELSIDFKELGLKSTGGDEISLIMSVIAQLSYLDASGKPRSKSATFTYESPPSPVSSWVENYNDFIALRFQDSYLILSENIVAAMMKK